MWPPQYVQEGPCLLVPVGEHICGCVSGPCGVSQCGSWWMHKAVGQNCPALPLSTQLVGQLWLPAHHFGVSPGRSRPASPVSWPSCSCSGPAQMTGPCLLSWDEGDHGPAPQTQRREKLSIRVRGAGIVLCHILNFANSWLPMCLPGVGSEGELSPHFWAVPRGRDGWFSFPGPGHGC